MTIVPTAPLTAGNGVTVDGLTAAEQATLNALLAQLWAKAPRNALRSAYYDGKNAVRDLGISTPPAFRKIATVLGWSSKAVDILNRRCNLDGFVLPSQVAQDDVDALWRDNWLDSEAPQAGVSSLIHAAAFLVTTQGDTAAGEPPVLITAKDAMSGTGIWDRRRRSLSSFLSILEVDQNGRPADMVMYLPDLNVMMTRNGTGWNVTRRAHQYGLPVEPLVYQPRLGRPFGSSRISRPVMSLHDSALRTVIRSEVSAEFYSAPQRVLLGADESAFKNPDGTIKSTWQAIMGRIWAIPDDEGAANPRAQIQEFTQSSQQPHVDQLRAWAQLFAGETSIPVSSLGISTEANPASAEAYTASREDLISEAEGTTDGWSPAWRKTMIRALQMLNGWDDRQVPADVLGLRPKWRSPMNPSRAAAADAASKMIDKFPWLAQSELGLELYGMDQTFLERAKVELRRQRGAGVLAAIQAQAAAVADSPVTPAVPLDGQGAVSD